jgi:hypothetical protein
VGADEATEPVQLRLEPPAVAGGERFGASEHRFREAGSTARSLRYWLISWTEKPSPVLMASKVGDAVLDFSQDAVDACAVAWATKQTNARAVGTCHEGLARAA